MGWSRRAWRPGALLAVAVLLVGCGGGNEDSSDKQPVKAADLCEGNLSAKAGAAVELITGTKEFQPMDLASVKRGAEEIVSDYQTGSTFEDRDACLIYKSGTSALVDIRVRFSLDDGRFLSTSGDAPSVKTYGMGRKALASPRKAVLYIECSSAKMSESSPALLRGELLNRDEPEGDAEELRRANLTVLHSVALALTKELGCADDAGLPAKPSFT
ncbi:hypothetical protein ACFS5L_36530 [Streptomyces phyllanthi]|uniref:DUF3558 domain-containing protein n=1 Tax=Streptomyces phyllanthi TaxID=1803180 RepID=A0A5N8W5C1_9ACTN|nr:hypothetical protein [Streptomyces phyllanthi]MPY42096.1 hypothetical protein [Streptomyces phyllanthi]